MGDIKKILFLMAFVCVGWGNLCLAGNQKIVLLTSIDPERDASCMFVSIRFRNYIEKIEKLFINEFSSFDYKIEVVRNADQYYLWRALHDPVNVAVFWLGHAGYRSSQDLLGNGSFSFNKILDVNGYEVTPVFQKIHPNLRFLGIIGCHSAEVIDSLKLDHPDLKILTFDRKIDARKGLRIAMSEAKLVLQKPEILRGYSPVCPIQRGYEIAVDRLFLLSSSIQYNRHPAFSPSARLLVRGEPVGVFPRGQGELRQTESFFIPARDESAHILPALTLDVGENVSILKNAKVRNRLDVGLLKILLQKETLPDVQPWALWQMPDGQAIGIFANGYKPTPMFSLVSEEASGQYLPYMTESSEFVCAPMPSYSRQGDRGQPGGS